MRLRGRTAIVTGASSGIGRATALHLAARGMRVVAAARSAERLATLQAERPDIEVVTCDVTSSDDRRRLLDATGDVDLLVNNAGLGWTGFVQDMTEDDVLRLLHTNVVGLIELTRLALPGMLARRRGHVVNVSSVAGFVSIPPLSVYSATKFAVEGFTRGLRREVWGSGVTAATINPGPIATEFGIRASGMAAPPEALRTGIGSMLCARAVVRSARLRNVPGYQTISVPRVMGLARVAAVPPVSVLGDVAFLLLRPLGLREGFRRSDPAPDTSSPPRAPREGTAPHR